MDTLNLLENKRSRKLLELERRVKQLKKQTTPRPQNEIDRLEDIIQCVRKFKKYKNNKTKNSWSNVFPFKLFARLGVIPQATRQPSEKRETQLVENPEDISNAENRENILIEEYSPPQVDGDACEEETPIPKETHLHVDANKVHDATSLISALNSQSPLQPVKICISFISDRDSNRPSESPNSRNSFASLFLAFNQFKNNLESLELDLERLNGNPTDLDLNANMGASSSSSSSAQGTRGDQSWILDINLRKLKNLSIKGHRGSWAFLLCLPTLENLSLLKCHACCFNQEKVVQLMWSKRGMYESIVWKYLPKLQTFQMERVGDPSCPEFPELNWKLTREIYNMVQDDIYARKEMGIKEVSRSGRRRWWRNKKYFQNL